MNIAKSAKTIGRFVTKYAPTIFETIEMVGFITATLLAIEGTVEAVKDENDIPEEVKESEEHPTISLVKREIKHYIPAIGMTTLAIASGILSHNITASRTAMLTAAYQFAERYSRDYQEKVKEVLGPEKEAEIRQEVNQKQAKEAMDRQAIISPSEKYLIRDPFSGEYMLSTMNEAERNVNELNRQGLQGMCVCVNDWLDIWGIDHVQNGDDFGWNMNSGLVWISDVRQKQKANGAPYLEYELSPSPRSTYRDY